MYNTGEFSTCNTQSVTSCPDEVVIETDLPLQLAARGKVRDIYGCGDGRLLFVTTDRISAFDCILGSGIPCKGRVLNQLSLFWFDFLGGVVRSHVITPDISRYPRAVETRREMLQGRSVLVKAAKMIPVECVARGYLAGSGWKEYQASETVCGVRLPSGLRDGDRLPEPIFTPAMKAHSGHDTNVSFEEVASTVGGGLAAELRKLTLEIYNRAAAYAMERGLILADTKFEFGFDDEGILLADEVLTPDSSRYWPADTYSPGRSQISFDKQYVRDYLETLHWDKRPPGPILPADVVERTSQKYQEAFARLTGRNLMAQSA